MSVSRIAAVALAATALLGVPAQAAPSQAACVGTQQLVYVCVTPPSLQRRYVEQCVYAGGDTCENVTVPYYGLGNDLSTSCGGSLADCHTVDNLDDLFKPCGPLVACP